MLLHKHSKLLLQGSKIHTTNLFKQEQYFFFALNLKRQGKADLPFWLLKHLQQPSKTGFWPAVKKRAKNRPPFSSLQLRGATSCKITVANLISCHTA
jgi:hypothetical protein